jgi:plasmid stabilization system protein ParE
VTRRIRIGPRAQAQIEQASDWWFEHRPAAPDLFDEELARAIATIREMPGAGQPVAHATRPGIRRLFMGRIRYHLYYLASDEYVDVLALWHTARGSQPVL